MSWLSFFHADGFMPDDLDFEEDSCQDAEELDSPPPPLMEFSATECDPFVDELQRSIL